MNPTTGIPKMIGFMPAKYTIDEPTNSPTTINAIVSRFSMSLSSFIGSCEPTSSILTRSCPRVSMRAATFDSVSADSRPCSA